MAAFQFFITWGNIKLWWAGDDSHVAFGKKLPGEKGSVRRCFVVMKQPVLLPP
jgi:hypothetical protein